MSFCKHIWDIYARVTTDVFQGMPCTKCDAVLELGTMKIKTNPDWKGEQDENVSSIS